MRWWAAATLAVCLWAGPPSAQAQSVVIGGDAQNTNGTTQGPINDWYAYQRYQVVYLASELSAAGMPSGASITALGFSISEDNGPAFPGYTIGLAHTSATNSAAHNSATLTTVFGPASYNAAVTAAGVHDMITFSTPFAWDGASNILVDICTGTTAMPYASPYGGVRASNMTNGSRYAQSDGSAQCSVNTASSTNLRPQIRLNYTGGTPCAGTPAPGNTTGPAMVSAGANFLLGLQNATPGAGVSYQWYASTTSATGPWTAVGPNLSVYNTSASADSWYYCEVTCSAGPGTGASSVLFVEVLPTYAVPLTGNNSVVCGTDLILTDNGGSGGNYGTNANGYTVLEAGTGGIISITGPYATESGWDYVRLYDGAGTGGVQLQSVSGNGSLNYTGTAGQTLTIQLTSDGSNNFAGFEFIVSYSGQCYPTCTSTPNPGNTTGPALACAATSFVLGIDNPSTDAGISYQWELSSDGQTWSNAPGASTNATYSTSQSNTTWYRVQMTCAGHGTAASTPLEVGMNLPTACYCTPTGAANNSDEIRNFTLANINNNSAASEGTNGYMDYTGSVAAAQLLAGTSYTASLTSGAGSGSHEAALWIDYNDDGVFDAAELVATIASISQNSTEDFTPFVPAPAHAGIHRARVQYIYNFSATPDPCTVTTTFAETEDYLVEVTVPPACSGIPDAGTITASQSLVCLGIAFNLNGVAGNELGLTYQWQSSPAGAGSWSDISGATNSSYTVSAGITASTDYRLVVTCTNSAESATSNVASVALKAITECYCTVGGNNSSYYIDSFTTTGASQNISNTGSGYSTGGYGNFGATHTVSQNAGASVGFTATYAANNTFGLKVWVDWNQDGDYSDPGEQVYASTSYAGSHTGSFTVPLTATAGTTRMRIGNSYTPSSGPSSPCLISLSGEYEDYSFEVIPPPSCSGTPDAGTVTASQSLVCPGIAFNLNGVAGNELGLTYQWQSSPAGAGAWSDITGATNASYTVSAGITASTDYRLVVTCTNSNESTFSNVATVTLKAVADCYCTASSNTVEPICNVTFAGINNTSATTGGAGYEDFTGLVAPAQVSQGAAYQISVSGNTDGGFTNYFTAFFDWDRNGTYETAVPIGSIVDDECSVVINATVSVPANAATGITRMRVIKNFNSAPGGPCGNNSYGQVEDYLVNVNACTKVEVNITTDGNPGDLSWEITDANSVVIASGAPAAANQLVSEAVCIGEAPVDACFGFRIMDSFGDGITGGGWELRTPDGRLILRDEFADGSQSPSATPQTPSYGSGHSFCLPEGPSRIMANECNVFTNGMYDKVYCSKVTGATQYQFEFSNPDAGYMRRIARPHNYVVFYEMVSSPLVPGVVYFTRARTNEQGPLASAHWGSGCDLGLGIAQVVQCTQLIQAPAYGHSCNETRSFTAPYNYLYARPVTGATTYTFKITGDDGNYNSGIEFVRNTYILALGWGTDEAPALTDQTTYQVQVRVTVNGIEGAYCGNACNVIIDNNPGLGMRLAQTEGQPEFNLWPNPNNGQHLNVALSGLDSKVSTADVRLMDLTGRVALGTQLNVVNGAISSVIELGNAANGTYLLQVIAGGKTYTKRVVVSK